MSFLSLAIVVFVVVAVAVFAFIAATIAPKSVLGERLRALGSQQPNYYMPPVSAVTEAVRPPALIPQPSSSEPIV